MKIEKDFEEFLQLLNKHEGKIIQLGYEPLRIDIITSIGGLSFKEIWKNKAVGKYGNADVFFIDLDGLIKCKELSGRKQDMADLEILQSVKNKKMSSHEN